MNSMMQPVSGLGSSAAQAPIPAAGVKAAPEAQKPETQAPARAQKPMRDEYTPEEKREPSGLYWLGRDEDGQPKLYFDDPEAPDGPSNAPAPARKPAGEKAERCTGSTDQVDREIERLKRQKSELERQISAQPDAAKAKVLEQKLAQVERELAQKDNDAYRRQHTVFS